MLKFFRDQKNSWLMKGILILTALSFVSLFGSGRFLEKIPDEGKAIAKIHGEKITVAEFVNEVNHKVRSLSNITQKPFTIQDFVQSGMLISLFNQMISRSVMQAAVDDLNITVSDQAVRDEIKDMPVFTDYDGSFSMAAYKQYLSDMGISEKRFIDDAFLDMRAQQLTNAAKTVTIVPQKTAETLYSLQNEKRTADVFTITPADIRIKGNPNKEDQERLYKELSDDLIAPEYRTFTVMYLTLEDVAKKIKISEEELLEVYNENKDSYAIEEIRDVDQMLFTSKEEADEAYAALQKGQDFMEVAKKYANQTEDQTKLGDLTPSTATGDWADVVFSVKKGEIVPPVQTAFGWQILRVNKITPKVEKQFKDVRDEIEQKLIDSMAYDTLSETAVALDDRFGAGETIEEVAQSTGYPVKKYTLIDPAGSDESGKQIDISKTVLATAFLSEPGRETPMTEEGSDYFVLRIDDVKEPALKPIEKSQKEIKAAWIAEKQRKKAQEIVKTIEKDLNKGVAPKTIAQKTGAKYKRISGITRRDTQLPVSATYQLFNKPLKEPFFVPAESKFLVLKGIKTQKVDPKKDQIGVAELRRMMQEQTAAEKSDAILGDFADYLKLEINENIAQKAFSYITKSAQDSEEDY